MKLPKQTIRDVPLDDKTVLVRADYNVPLDEHGAIDDDYRIRQSLPTLQYLLEQNCKIVICSHLGRPEGKNVPEFSLEPVAQHLANLIGRRVHFIPTILGDRAEQAIKSMENGHIALLENVRFYAEEEQNDMEFARGLKEASSAEYFIQDGFGVVHRKHASTDAITKLLPSVAGLLLEKEFTHLTQVRANPKRPLTAVLGGAKISDKITLVDDFVQLADKVIIGGAMANNFLRFLSYPVGKSKVEDDVDEIVARIIGHACSEKHRHHECLINHPSFILPVDVAVAKSLDEDAPREVKRLEDVEDDDYILDIGDSSIDHMITSIEDSQTVLWNGTLGFAEHANFAHGSARLAQWLAEHKDSVRSVIGGGDTADFVLHWDSANGASFTHVSTGGGASLELLAGETLPGIEALLDK